MTEEKLKKFLNIEYESAEEDGILIQSSLENWDLCIDIELPDLKHLESLIDYLQLIKEGLKNPKGESKRD